MSYESQQEKYEERARASYERFRERLDDDPEALGYTGPTECDVTQRNCLVFTLPGASVTLLFDEDGGVLRGYYDYQEPGYKGLVFPIGSMEELERIIEIYGLENWDWSAT